VFSRRVRDELLEISKADFDTVAQAMKAKVQRT
jgi:hypothetical protein